MAIKESLKQRNSKFQSGITSAGQIKKDRKNKKDTSKPAISPTLVGLLIFIIVGSAVVTLAQVLFSSYLTPAPSYEITPEMMAQYRAQQAAEQEAAGFGNLSDFPLSNTYEVDPSLDAQIPVTEEVNLDENEVENE